MCRLCKEPTTPFTRLASRVDFVLTLFIVSLTKVRLHAQQMLIVGVIALRYDPLDMGGAQRAQPVPNGPNQPMRSF